MVFVRNLPKLWNNEDITACEGEMRCEKRVLMDGKYSTLNFKWDSSWLDRVSSMRYPKAIVEQLTQLTSPSGTQNTFNFLPMPPKTCLQTWRARTYRKNPYRLHYEYNFCAFSDSILPSTHIYRIWRRHPKEMDKFLLENHKKRHKRYIGKEKKRRKEMPNESEWERNLFISYHIMMEASMEFLFLPSCLLYSAAPQNRWSIWQNKFNVPQAKGKIIDWEMV